MTRFDKVPERQYDALYKSVGSDRMYSGNMYSLAVNGTTSAIVVIDGKQLTYFATMPHLRRQGYMRTTMDLVTELWSELECVCEDPVGQCCLLGSGFLLRDGTEHSYFWRT